METTKFEFEIKNDMDAIRGTKLLIDHINALIPQTNPRIIVWQSKLIADLAAALIAYNPNYMEFYKKWQSTAI